MTLDELKTEIAAVFDEDGLLDFLDIDITELVEILEDVIHEREEDFSAYLSL